MSLKRTAFYDTHAKLGAKIVPFAGFEMPVKYTSLKVLVEFEKLNQAAK